MKPASMRLIATTIFSVLFLSSSGALSVDAARPYAGSSLQQPADAQSWSQLSANKPKADHITFSAQPTREEIEAFAKAGGKMVINARTVGEMDRLGFDEKTLVESLGMDYVHIPTNGTTFGYKLRDQFTAAMNQQEEPVLCHCKSGSRIAGIYALYRIKEFGVEMDQAIEEAQSLGMSRGMIPLIKRTVQEAEEVAQSESKDQYTGAKPVSTDIQVDVADRVMGEIEPKQIRHTIDTLVGFGTRHTLSETKSDSRGIGAARRWVKSQFEANVADSGKVGDEAPKVYFDPHTVEPDGRRITEPVEVVNVICELPGSSPESRGRLYYVLGHLDSRASQANDSTSDAPGANDDGSGVAAMIELARVLSKEHLESTVVLMATSGEEQGLFGATLHAEQASKDGKDIRAVLSNDTVGDPAGVLPDQNGRYEIRVFSEGLPASMLALEDDQIGSAARRLRLYGTESDSTSRQLARYIAEVAKAHKTAVQPRLIFRPDRFLRGGDHTPFNNLGFAAIRFCEVYENYDHQHQDIRVENGVQYGDLPKYVDEDYLADVTRLNAAALINLANSPSAPGNTRVIIADLTNDTTLRWDASPEPDVAGYEIVWRSTTAPNWEHTQDVGDTTHGTVPLSKDNWLFGVRSYDHDGYRSLVSYPRPSRE